MINSLGTIAFFGCSLTSRYRKDLCRSFNTAAEEYGVNVVYFNFLGKIGNINAQYGDYEFDFLDYIDLDQYIGIIFDGEGYNVEGMADKVIAKLRTASCPVVSISSHVDGFYNIEFDDNGGVKAVLEHFLDHHGFTRIGFMSGYLTHPDAQLRLGEFRTVMRSRGLPEDGVGMFEGDFWFSKGEEAADFFLSRPERPQAVVCANDYMAVALASSLKKRGIRVPQDIAVSGYDGSVEGREFVPHITSVTRERMDIARKSISILVDLASGVKKDFDMRVCPKLLLSQSCGCLPLDYKVEAENINDIYSANRYLVDNMYNTESLMLEMNKLDRMNKLESLFSLSPLSIREYSGFVLMMHVDSSGRPAHDSDFEYTIGRFTPAIWIDKKGDYVRKEGFYEQSTLIPDIKSDKPHFFYVMSVHCAERMFGYAFIEMADNDIFNEFYNVWILNLSITIERLYKNDRINKLIGTLEDLSIRDGLTGMLNRRGFEELSREALRSLDGRRTVCAMVIDMDGLKRINDDYGHHEGDCAIKTAANIITKCCDAGEIAGRAGGDEFYIYAPEYSEKKLARFMERLVSLVKVYNMNSNKPYELELSYGSYILETDNTARLEELISISDSRMYEQKQAKPNRRKR